MFYQQAFRNLSGTLVLSVLPLTVTVGLPTAATASLSPQNFDEIYVFGDSLSDVGNVFTATGGLVQSENAYPPSPPYFNGRFSDGPLWVEYLGQKLRLTPTPYTATLGVGGAIPTEGINFAFGGASSGFINAVRPDLPVQTGLLAQVSLYAGPFVEAQQSVNPNALYTVWAGANDYLSLNTEDVTTPVNNISLAVSSLAAVGAKNIMVVNLPGFDEHNSELNVALAGLSQNTDTNIIPLDVDSLFDQVIANPSAFGFTNVTDPCLVQVSATQFSQCPNPNEYLLWDQVHPTTAVHELVGKLAYSELTPEPVPEPSDAWGVLALGAVGMGYLFKRKHLKFPRIN